MALAWERVVVHASYPEALGRWWASVLRWVVVDDAPDESEIPVGLGSSGARRSAR